MCTARERACACVSCVVCVGHVCHVGRSLLPYGEVSFDVSHTCARSIRAGRSRRLLPHMSHHMSHHHTHMSHHHTHAAFAPAALGVCCHICHIICHIIIHICHIIIHTQHSRRPLSAFGAGPDARQVYVGLFCHLSRSLLPYTQVCVPYGEVSFAIFVGLF